MSETPTERTREARGRTIGLLLGAAILLSLVQCASLPATPKFLGVINNFAHGPVFGALALVLLRLLLPRLRPRIWLAYGAALSLAVAAGVALEILQIFSSRDASLADALTDAAGAGCALCVAAYFDRSAWRADRRSRGRAAVLFAGFVLLVVLLIPLGHALIAYSVRTSQFPTVMKFSSRMDLYFTEARDAETALVALPQVASGGDRGTALRIRFFGDDWPGISNIEPSPDWRQYRVLKLDVMNTGASALVLGLRVHDIGRGVGYDDRFNTELALAANARQVFVVPLTAIESGPVGRKLDLSRIGGLVLFRLSPRDAEGSGILLSRVWLE